MILKFVMAIIILLLLLPSIGRGFSSTGEMNSLEMCIKNKFSRASAFEVANAEKEECVRNYFLTPPPGKTLRECIDSVKQFSRENTSLFSLVLEKTGELKCLKLFRQDISGLDCLSQASSSFNGKLEKIVLRYCLDTDNGNMSLDDCLRYQSARSMRSWEDSFQNKLLCVEKIAPNVSHLECLAKVDQYLNYRSFFLDESFKSYYEMALSVCRGINDGNLSYCTPKDAAWAAILSGDAGEHGSIIRQRDTSFAYAKLLDSDWEVVAEYEIFNSASEIASNNIINPSGAGKNSWVELGILDRDNFSDASIFVGFVKDEKKQEVGLFYKRSKFDEKVLAIHENHLKFKGPLFATDPLCRALYRKSYFSPGH